MKLKISRSMTINTGNFTSIKPSIELSMDVKRELGNFEVAYKHLSKVADCLMIYELLTLSDEMQTINDAGWGRYNDLMKHNVDKVDGEFRKNVDELMRYEL